MDEATTQAPEQEPEYPGVKPETFDFFAGDETDTVYLDPPTNRYWVRIKRELDFGEQNKIDNALIRKWQLDGGQMNGQAEGGMGAVVDIGYQRTLKLALYIDDWNIPDSAGKTVRWPARLDERVKMIERLKGRRAVEMLAEIDRRILEANQVIEAEPVPDGNPINGAVPEYGSAST